jgi:hypothetical protein
MDVTSAEMVDIWPNILFVFNRSGSWRHDTQRRDDDPAVARPGRPASDAGGSDSSTRCQPTASATDESGAIPADVPLRFGPAPDRSAVQLGRIRSVLLCSCSLPGRRMRPGRRPMHLSGSVQMDGHPPHGFISGNFTRILNN